MQRYRSQPAMLTMSARQGERDTRALWPYRFLLMSYSGTVEAICSELHNRYAALGDQSGSELARVADAIIECQRAMPDYLRLPMRVLTLVFDYWGWISGGSRFERLDDVARAQQFNTWKYSRFGFCRNFVRFYESLYLLITLQEDAH